MRTTHNGRMAPVPAIVLAALTLFLPKALGQSSPTRFDATNDHQRVTLNVENADLSQVLNAFSLQTGRSVVIGPDVQATVNMRLQNVPWKEALDVVLRPYGYGYQVVGDTIIVNSLASIRDAEGIEPVVSRVFQLRFLDAKDVQQIVENVLSPRGRVSLVTVRGQKGWEFESTGNRRSFRGGAGLSKRIRILDDDDQVRSKTLVVSDIPSVLTQVASLLEEVDRKPEQVLIEATFVEIDSDFLKDVGVEFGTGVNGAESEEVQSLVVREGSDFFGVGAQQTSGQVSPGNFDPRSEGLSETEPFNAGLSLVFQKLNDSQFQVLLHLLEEDVSANLLSTPSILTLNNQEAGIVVGTKFPIIRSDTSGLNGNISTSVDYYENIGIQLNVVPQICDNGYINMIVHPAVTDQIGTASARTGATGNVPLTEYPVVATREAETQIMIRSGQRIVIGGLLEDRERTTVVKVPLLGDIPLLGHLFRRETDTLVKTDLLIILSATIVESDDMETDRGRIERPEYQARALDAPDPDRADRPASRSYDTAPTSAQDDLLDGDQSASFLPVEWPEPNAALSLRDSGPNDSEQLVLRGSRLNGGL